VKSFAAPAVLILAILVFSAFCLAQSKPRTVWDGVYSKPQADRGEDRYARQCAQCHGDDLEGDVVENPSLAGGTFRDKWNGLNLAQLYERIHRDMPLNQPGTLSKQTSLDLVAFLLSSNGFPSGPDDLPADPHQLESIVIQSVRK